VNWVDVIIISVVVLSALLAFIRGLVREVLGIGAWVGAGFFAVWAFPYGREQFHHVIPQPDVADSVGFGVLFVVGLLVLSIVSNLVARLVRTSALGGLDRTLGTVFGLVRGAGTVALAYILAGVAVPNVDRWPEPVQHARTLQYVYEGAVMLVSLLPDEYRPFVQVPPEGYEVRAGDLLHVNPLGRAVGRP
jgi:membrane protein required for colicin V production